MWNNFVKVWRSWIRKNNDIAALPFILVAVVIFMTLSTSGKFLSLGNFNSLASQIPELGLLSLAIMVIMITGGIDLSTISIANLVAVIMAIIMTRLVPEGTGSSETTLGLMLAAFATGIVLSLILGCLNGILVAYIGLPAMLATLGTMILYEGITLVITNGYVISGLPDMYTGLSSLSFIGIPLPLFIFSLAVVAMAVVLGRTPFGKYLFMIGSSETATRYSAIDTRKVLVKAYTISGFLSGIAGMIMVARFNSANARQGTSLQLLSILISVLGGTDPDGGFGKVGGVTLALLVLQVITSGLNLLGMNTFLAYTLWGVLLILVITYRYYITRERHSS